MTGTLDTLTNLELQCLGLWILLRTSSGRNDRDSGILLLTSSGMTAQTCGDPEGGQGVRTPSGKSQVICVFMEISIWTPPPEKCWTPPCIAVKSVEGLKKRCCGCFLAVGPPPYPSPPLTKIPGSVHRKEIVIASPRHLNYVHVVITSKVMFKHFPTAIFPSYGTTVSFSIPQTYHLLI